MYKILILWALSTFGLLSAAVAQAEAQLRINCDRGQSLQDAIERLRQGGTVRVAGTCEGPIAISRDHIRLVGEPAAVIEGGAGGPEEFAAVLRVRGASNVVIENITVVQGAGDGIAIEAGAAVELRRVTASGNQLTGLFVDGASVDLSNFEASDNNLGVDAINGARLLLQDDIVTDQNAGNGFELNFGAVAEVRGARLSSSNNGRFGYVVGSSVLAIAGFSRTLSVGNLIEANDNGAGGMVLASSTLQILGANAEGLPPPHTIRMLRNANGLIVPQDGSIASPNGTARFEIQNNGTGLVVGNASSIEVKGGLSISSNGVGLVGSASTLVVTENVDNPNDISGNFGPDVILLQGANAVLDVASPPSVVNCDSTVLSTSC